MRTKLSPEVGHVQEPMSGAEGGALAQLSRGETSAGDRVGGGETRPGGHTGFV